MKKHKILVRVITVALCALLLLAAAIILLAAFAFSPKPQIPPVQLSFDDLRRQHNLGRRISAEIAEAKLTKSRIVLSSEDIASLTRSADCVMTVATLTKPELAQLPPLRYMAPSLDDDIFSITLPYDTGYSRCFGGWLIGHFCFRASYRAGQLDLVPVSGKIGKITLPDFILKPLFERIEKELKQRQEYAVFKSVVLRFGVNEDGDLEIVYSPTAAAVATSRYAGGKL